MKRIIALFVCSFIVFQGISQKDNHSKFAIKFAPSQLVMGELHFAYEQRILPQSSIEVSLGPTVSEIGLTPIILENIAGNANGMTKESAMGFFGALAYRYYPISGLATAPRGLYIAPEIKYRLYNTSYVDEFYGMGERTGAATQISFKFFTGFQFWLGSKFSIDVFSAVGIGSTSVRTHFVNGIYDPVSNTTTMAWDSYSKSRVSFTGSMGFKFGIGGARKDK